MRTLDLLASDASHLPFLYVFKDSKVMEKYGYEIDLHIVGDAKAPTMAHRAKLALAGEIDFLSGLHHETYRERAKGEKRLTYLAQAQNNWDDRLVALALEPHPVAALAALGADLGARLGLAGVEGRVDVDELHLPGVALLEEL